MKLLPLQLGEKFRGLQAGFELHFLREWDRDQETDFAPYEHLYHFLETDQRPPWRGVLYPRLPAWPPLE